MKGSRELRESSGFRKSRPKKRKNVFNPKTAETSETSFSTSAKKLHLEEKIDVPRDTSIEYRILNFITVFAAISEYVKCKTCDGNVKFETASQRGLGFKIVLLCDKCASRSIHSSPFIEHSYAINRRFLFVMRVLGLGLKGATKFCGLMDMPPFLTQTTYDLIIKNIHSCVQVATEKLLQCACTEEKELTSEHQNDTNPTELTVSGDGTWKKRGFTSLYGVTSLIGYYSGKIIDIFVKSSYCKQCESWKMKLDTEEYNEWYESHKDNCSANHIGSAGKMEVEAAISMFKRSVEKFNVQYRNYVGDGDSKTYSGILKAAPYGDKEVIKKECIGHVQKRMGMRLRDCVKKNVVTVEKSGKTRQKKTLGGKGKLTGKLIDKLTVYYGLAIRRNCDSVENMYNAIWATYYHYCSTNENPQHEKCPTGPESWCPWQRAAAANKLSEFEHDYDHFPRDVAEALHPIYTDLSNEKLLERCVGGFTQNSNESYNQLVWKISPKIIPSGSRIVEMAANIGVGMFNEGTSALLHYMSAMGLSLGPNAHSYAEKEDAERVKIAEQRAQENTREGRMVRRQHQIGILEAANTSEELLYGPGIDDSM
ncbi:hypothetical protein ALC62_00134 [Cyphomyrmex costatus]|uniref:Mutator-like transposase domain-containing protein n=1 Tax=Cyphomyrmex costatus TaxID=456900 RepID=A0A151K1V7_9HYME|nr:hypothetical protein ALC62_12635 [Cyphomyrmex costatus]KYN50106.1 hypothetical protein ALC62_00134 [Cyphomyrmex costatus]